MPLTRHQITIDAGGPNEVTIEVEPFEWPRNPWEVLEFRASRDTHLSSDAVTKLQASYNGAHGQVLQGLDGLIVQYVENTGGPAITVMDWRGNSGLFAWLPDTGLEVEEIPGTASEAAPTGPALYTVTGRLVPVG